MSIFGAGAICGAITSGKVTDKIGFYTVQISALTGGGIMFIVLGQMEGYIPICVCTFILSFVNESFRPANSTAIAHYSKEENRTRSYSLNRLAINLGWSFGGALGGFIAAKNYHLLFWIDGLTNLAAAIFLRIVLSPSRNEATPSMHDIKPGGEKYAAYKDKAYLAFIFFTILYGYMFYQLFTTQPVYLKEKLHISEQYIGLLMGLNGLLIVAFEMVTVYSIEGRRAPLHFASVGVLLVGISLVIFNLFSGRFLLALTSMLIVTVGEILSMSFLNTYWVGRTSKSNTGQYAALYTIAWSTSQVLGPGTGAQIAEHFSYKVLWWVMGSVAVITAIGYRWVETRSKKNQYS
jgi:predicted MFS family arabinose efflux permease